MPLFSKIVNSDTIKDYILNRLDIVYKFNLTSKRSVKFGIKNAINFVQNNKSNNNISKEINSDLDIKCLIFIFYTEKIEILVDLIIHKLENQKVYLLDESYK